MEKREKVKGEKYIMRKSMELVFDIKEEKIFRSFLMY